MSQLKKYVQYSLQYIFSGCEVDFELIVELRNAYGKKYKWINNIQGI